MVEDPLDPFVVRADVPWEERDGVVLVAFPRPQSRVAALFGRLLRAPENVSVRFDEIGSRAWLLADGTRTGREILRDVALAFPAAAEGGEERLRVFLGVLKQNGLATFAYVRTPAPDTLRGFPEALGYVAARCRRCGNVTRVKRAGAVYRCPGCARLGRAAP